MAQEAPVAPGSGSEAAVEEEDPEDPPPVAAWHRSPALALGGEPGPARAATRPSASEENQPNPPPSELD